VAGGALFPVDRAYNGGSAMSDEDGAKAEKDFAKDKEWVEKTAVANRLIEAVMEELYLKHKGDEEKVRREFKRLMKEDDAFAEAVLRSTFDDLWRAARRTS
jgi:hypothetical protein